LLAACVHEPVVKKPVPIEAVAPLEAKEAFYVQAYKQDPDETRIQVGRYAYVNAAATPDQKDLLRVVIQTSIPNDITTIGDAVDFLLMRSGFAMADKEKQGAYVSQLLAKPLPYAHRNLGPITLKDALLLLVGNAYWMKADPVHRLIAFETVKEFQ